MAFAVERESVSIVKISEYYKIVVNLLCNIVFLNFDSFQLAGVYPIYIEFIDLKKDTPPNEEYISKLFEKIYFTDSSSIFNLLKERLKHLNPKKDARLALRINNLEISDAVSAFLAENNIQVSSYKSNIANRFTDSLSSKLNIAVLPYAKDHMSGKMSLVFSDARVQNFTIPEATYSMDFTINSFVKQPYKETPAEKAFVYGIVGNAKVYQPEIGRTYFDDKIKSAVVKVFPNTQESSDEPAIYDDLIDIFILDSSKQMQNNKKFKEEVLKRCLNI